MSCCPGNKSCGPPKPTDNIRSSVQEFYASKQKTAELASAPPPCASACPIGAEAFPPAVTAALALVHADVKDSYFGCGLPYPSAVEGCRVLDLGSGTGRDVFLLACLAGAEGSVVGVDMTPAMLEKSRGMIPYHAEKFGFSNVEFKQGVLEDLDKVEGLEPNSFDIIISNCVINLTQDKTAVFRHAFNLLKPGGELCFSDVYSAAPMPKEVRENRTAWNECYSGALVWSEFAVATGAVGFRAPLVISEADYVAYNEELADILKNLQFWSKTLRLFKPGGTETAATRVEYLGTIRDCPDAFALAQDAVFKKGELAEPKKETLQVLFESRFAKHFRFH